MNNHYYTQYAAIWYQDWKFKIKIAHTKDMDEEESTLWQKCTMQSQAEYVMALALKI